MKTQIDLSIHVPFLLFLTDPAYYRRGLVQSGPLRTLDTETFLPAGPSPRHPDG